MRNIAPFLLLLAFASVSCSKNINQQVREAVRQFDNLDLTDQEIEVLSTQQLGDHAVAELKVKTAVKLARKNGKWEVQEVRIGDRRWEKAEHILAVINTKRRESTLKEMETISRGIRAYAQDRGQMPEAADYRGLLAVITPGYLAQALPYDAWSNPYLYRRLSPGQAQLRSAGQDGSAGTADDLVESIAQ